MSVAQRNADPVTEGIVKKDDGTWVLQSADGHEATITVTEEMSADSVRDMIAAAHAAIVRVRGH